MYAISSLCIPFLDVNVNIIDRVFATSVFRKSTHTGVFLNYLSMAPTAWKKGLIYCLINRAKVICSTSSLFNIEVNNLKEMFINNSYPAWFFDRVLEQFLQKRNTSSDENPTTDGDTDTVDDNLPYVLFEREVFNEIC